MKRTKTVSLLLSLLLLLTPLVGSGGYAMMSARKIKLLNRINTINHFDETLSRFKNHLLDMKLLFDKAGIPANIQRAFFEEREARALERGYNETAKFYHAFILQTFPDSSPKTSPGIDN